MPPAGSENPHWSQVCSSLRDHMRSHVSRGTSAACRRSRDSGRISGVIPKRRKHQRMGDVSEIVRRQPLVVVCVIDDLEGVARLADELAARHPGEVFIGIISGEDAHEVRTIIDGLWACLGEMIFTSTDSLRSIDGSVLANTALNEFGVGQDFVFTVPALHDAVRYAIGRLVDDEAHWEGTAVLVLGSAATIRDVRAHVSDDS